MVMIRNDSKGKISNFGHVGLKGSPKLFLSIYIYYTNICMHVCIQQNMNILYNGVIVPCGRSPTPIPRYERRDRMYVCIFESPLVPMRHSQNKQNVRNIPCLMITDSNNWNGICLWAVFVKLRQFGASVSHEAFFIKLVSFCALHFIYIFSRRFIIIYKKKYYTIKFSIFAQLGTNEKSWIINKQVTGYCIMTAHPHTQRRLWIFFLKSTVVFHPIYWFDLALCDFILSHQKVLKIWKGINRKRRH